MTPEIDKRKRRVAAFVLATSCLALALLAWLVVVDISRDGGQVNWIGCVLFAILLVLSETRPALWMRLGDDGQVTPGWAFAYSLILLGSPPTAIVVMVLTSCYVDFNHRRGSLKIIFNSAQVVASLSAGGLVLALFGLGSGISGTTGIDTRAALGIVLGGTAIFALNGLLLGAVISLHQGTGIFATMRAGFALSMTADGALLALAPVFVIMIEFSIVMLPLLGLTSYLVYHSARNALRREHEASHDPLTLLLNRRAFNEHLATALDGATERDRVAVLVMDLDRFKAINDRLGHQIGDRLLVSFADRLERSLPPMSRACRLGGDEFAALIPSLGPDADLHDVLFALREKLARPHDLEGFPLTVPVSIGVAVAPVDGSQTDQIVAVADVAMYRAKRHETGVEFGCQVNDRSDHGRIGLMHDLAAAIDNDEIRAAYQPQIDLETGAIVGVEALMRWTHTTCGPIPPNDFIGVAEQTDLIEPITEIMFRTAMTDLLRLGPTPPMLSVNVAPRSLLDRRFASRILSIVHEIGFPPGLLEIEITERAIATGSERSALTLEQFRDAGISVAIDDFGSGYSSFHVLRDLDVDRLKIDRHFTSRIIEDAADELIVIKIIELAHGLGVRVVAEGVESVEVWDRLRTFGCDVAQGHAIAMPMPIDELTRWMSDRTNTTSDTTSDTTVDATVNTTVVALGSST